MRSKLIVARGAKALFPRNWADLISIAPARNWEESSSDLRFRIQGLGLGLD